ncbi:MAG: hypothetical protein H7328_10975 [Bdellovibrio sp.]|nr:hypothetical protein [Bdellovibrio sp.]
MKFLALAVLLCSQMLFANQKAILVNASPNAQFYRDLILKVRQSGEFTLPIPGAQSSLTYSFDFDQPVFPETLMGDIHDSFNPIYFFRSFWDKILFKDGSYLLINGEKLPLTCLFVSGQDNRFSDKKLLSPLLPEFVLKVYLVANDFSCQGPVKPGWPATGGREENWDTYLYYEIKDPTIMLPMDAKLRYRWNEYSLVLVDRGSK